MPQPTQSQVHVDAILTNISTAYVQSRSNFIATTVFPIVPVEKQSDKYFTFTKGDWFRDEAQKRADNSESAGSGYTLSTDSYFADVWAFHKDIGQQLRANADNPLDPEREASEFVTQRLMLRQETQWTTDFFTPGKWDTDVVGGNHFALWSDYAGSDPIEDVEDGKEKILSTTGFMPNTLVLGYQVFRKLRNHPDFVDRIKYTSSNSVTTETLAKYFEVDRILISRAIVNTAKEGVAASMGFTAGKHAWLGYVAPSPSLMQPSAGYVFTWRGVSEGLGTNIGISRIEDRKTRSTRVEGQVAWDNKIVGADLGYFFSGAVA